MNITPATLRRSILPLLVIVTLVAFTGCKTKIGPGDTQWALLVDAYRHDAPMDGYTMHYIDIGQGDPVVMIHGFADSTYTWHENVKPLVDAGFRVIAVDQPGLGRSGVPPQPYEFTIENQAAEILKLTDRLDLQRFALVGSSMGGGITLYLSLEHPDRVSRAVVVSPSCFPTKKHHNIFAVPGYKHLAPMLAGRWAVRMALKDIYYNDELVDDVLVDEYSRPLNKTGYAKLLGSIREQYFSPEFTRMSQSYGRVRVPVLIVWGNNDKWVPLLNGAKLELSLDDSCLHVIPNAGHLAHQELPDMVNPIIIQFLETD